MIMNTNHSFTSHYDELFPWEIKMSVSPSSSIGKQCSLQVPVLSVD